MMVASIFTRLVPYVKQYKVTVLLSLTAKFDNNYNHYCVHYFVTSKGTVFYTRSTTNKVKEDYFLSLMPYIV